MQTASGLVPLLVGVTGHMDLCLCREAELRATVAGALQKLRGDSAIPVAVLCALASGADRLVAEVALKEGHSLVVPLPMPREEYENELRKSGEDDDSLNEFSRLLGQSRNSFVIPGQGSPEERYVAVGREIAQSSHIVIALWDGGSEEKPGGTAWVINERRGHHPSGCIPGGPPIGPVYHIQVRRKENGKCVCATNGEAPRGSKDPWLKPERVALGDRDCEDFQEHVCSYLKRFNKDARRFRISGDFTLEDAYIATDALAIKFRRLTTGVWFAIFGAVTLAALSFALFAHSEDHGLRFLGAYAAMLAIAIGTYLWARIADLQNKGQDYRALAEGLRVACGWRLLSISQFVSASYLLRQADEARWIRYALGAIERTLRAGQPIAQSEVVATALKQWIRPEWSYYTGNRDWTRSRSEWFEIISKIATFLSIGLGLSLFIGKIRTNENWFDGILVVSTLVAVVAALTHNIVEKLAWHEHARRYNRMSLLLEHTVQQLDPLDGPSKISDEEAICLLRAVAQEELDESGEWLQVHRARPLEIPGAN